MSTSRCSSTAASTRTAPGTRTYGLTPPTSTSASANGRVPGRGGCDRLLAGGAPGDPRHGGRGHRNHRFLDQLPAFAARLRPQGLRPAAGDPAGVALVISDAHSGLKAAVKAILPGAGWNHAGFTSPQRHPGAGLGPLQTGQRADLHHLRPNHQRGGRRLRPAGRRQPHHQLPPDRRDADRSRTRPDRVRDHAGRALAQDGSSAVPVGRVS